MVTLSVSMTAEQVREKVGVLDYSRVPVYDKGAEDVVGMVHRRDLLTALADDRGQVTLDELMRPVEFVAESLSLDRVLRMFMERRLHLLVVVDEFGGVAGLVTLEDVLEEILGREIVDEFDKVADLRALARRRRHQLQSPRPE